MSQTHAEKGSADHEEARRNIFSRLALFLRQVVAELRLVVRPTRQELVTYTTVVLVFVLFIMALVGGLDWVIERAMRWLFGRGI